MKPPQKNKLRTHFYRCTNKDLNIIDDLYVKMSIEEYSHLPKTDRPTIKEFKKFEKSRKKGFLKEINDKNHNLWYFIKVDNEIAGFMHSQLSNYNKKFARLEKLYITENFRKKGIGIKFVKFMLKTLKSRGIKTVEAGILYNNKPSLELHYKLGFKPYLLKIRKSLK